MRWAILVLCLPAAADYPSPDRAGFHHGALIYERDTRSADDLAWYVADRHGWLFDAFLFLSQRAASGASTMDGATSRADWLALLETWFAPGRDLHALDAAVARAAERLGRPPTPRRVMLMIPRPHRDAPGFAPPLGDEAGVRAAVAWYLDAARERFAAAGFGHLELWGGYWMHETIPPADEPLVRIAADELHRRGLRLLWIPWFRAQGWERWRACGIDVAILQPNYAFVSQHLGAIRRNRLAVTAELAREAGMGVEIEAPLRLGDALAERHFRDYLIDGGRLGYQHAATAYYLGRDDVERCAASGDARLRAVYELLTRYVRGERIDEPEQTWRREGDAWLADLPAGQSVAELDLFLAEPDGAPVWTGTARAEVERDGAWSPAGWARRGARIRDDGRHQVLTVPVAAAGQRLRVWFDGPLPPALEPRWHADAAAAERRHLAHLCPYQGDAPRSARYPDSGGELTDGRVPPGGYPSGGTVGWYGTPVTVTVDLGRALPVDEVRAVVQGGGTAAVHWPSAAEVLLSDAPPSGRLDRGLGVPPAAGAWRACGEPEILVRRADDDADATLTARFGGLPARYVTFAAAPRGWLMLAEIEVLSAGRNVAAGRPYLARPWPTDEQPGTYPDDGAKLTDGRLAEGFEAGLLVGWSDGAPRTWTLDLGEARAIRAVTVWSLRGGLYGIFAPREVWVEGSVDGQAWSPLGRATSSAEPELGGSATATPYGIAAETEVRFVRVRVAPGPGWAMVSEIEVQ